MEAPADGRVDLTIKARHPLDTKSLGQIKAQVIHMLRLDESLQEFYLTLRQARGNGEFDWIPKVRAGRLLRAPSIFEDIVKMICTTNCAWSATQRMVSHLVRKLGTPFEETVSCFPEPQQLAGATGKFLEEEIRTGYRSAYLIQLAERVATGQLKFDRWQTLREDALYREILSIKGVGPYAAGNLLRLLGHYQYLALDSWCRPKYAEIYRQGRMASDKTIARHYRKYGRWSGLVLWLDLTRDWFEQEERRPF
jgi:N-glycosylase/DNA lyase